MGTTTREQASCRNLLDQVKKTIPFTQGLILTTVPRGGLQVAQPATVGEPLLKAYGRGLDAEDRVTWQAITRNKPTRAQDAWSGDDLTSGPYYAEVMQPLGLQYVFAAPLAAPVLEGYPGVLQLSRSAEQGEFKRAEMEQVMDLVRKFDEKLADARAKRPNLHCPARPDCLERPEAHLAILDGNLKPLLSRDFLDSLDDRLRTQVLEQTRRKIHALVSGPINGESIMGDRLHLADSHGDHWTFRLVVYRHFPALTTGPVAFLCLQPDCLEWGGVKPADFQADPELSRLIPALKFMQQEYSRGPTLVEIAKTVSLSPFHFHRRFTELLGLTPKQFMLECQIHEAKVELLSGEKELVQVAKDCGFAHQSHFTSRFKQVTGLTPTRWRRMATERSRESEN